MHVFLKISVRHPPNSPVTPDPHGQWESIPLAFRRNAQRLEVPVAKEPPFCDVKTTTQLAEAQLKFDFDVMEDINHESHMI